MNTAVSRLRNPEYYSALAILCVVSLAGLTILGPEASALGQKARAANSFVDSIGVVTHLRYIDTAYRRFSDIIRPRLRELGIRHIRDGGKDKAFFKKLEDLATIGIKSTLVMDPRDGITGDNVINDVINHVRASIEAAEGPNEWDVQPTASYKGRVFPEGLRIYQTELYDAIKKNPSTNSIPVLMPSFAYPPNTHLFGRLQALDQGNMHSYAGGNIPSHDLDSICIPSAQVVSERKPIVATEAGWHNATKDAAASQPGISESAAAKYIPRLFLEYFNRGIRRTFLYEFIDQRNQPDQENNFGLLRADGSPKPAFTALKNLIQLLDDSAVSLQSQRLSFGLSGNLRDVHQTLLQKSNGSFYLVVWQEVRSFDLETKRDLAPIDETLTLTLHMPIRQAAGYYPLTSVSPHWQVEAPSQVEIRVPDHPLVIELVPTIP